MADTLRQPGNAVDSSEAHVADETIRDNSTTSDHDQKKGNNEDSGNDEEKRHGEEKHDEKEVEAVLSPVTGSAGLVGVSRNFTEVEAPANNGQDEKVAPVEQSMETDEKGDTKYVKDGKGDSEEEDEEANMVFPSGIQLALLTFGLCIAT
jgi:hypothetical protein